ncbi:MAG: exodeoxyribonuclease VII small subunit [Rickettsiales bacterium]|jgi:exodeoxyribonuclease VII small subunit
MTKSKNNFEKLDFEIALKQLEEIVEKLGNGKTNLEEMVELYEQGTLLKDHCNKKLSDAKMKVEKLMVSKDLE